MFKDRNLLVGLVLCTVLIGGAVVALKMMPPPQQPPPNAKTEKETPKVEVKSEWPTGARFAHVSADGKTVVVSIGRELMVAREGKELYRITHLRMLNPDVKLSTDGSRLAVYWLAKAGVSLWDVNERREMGLVLLKNNSIRKFSFSQDGSELKVGDGDLEFIAPTNAKSNVTSSAICSDDGRLVAVSQGNQVTLIKEGKELSKINSLENLEANRDGSRLAGYDAAKKAVVLMESDGTLVHAFPATSKVVFHFSLEGNLFGLLEPGQKDMGLYNTGNGSEHVRLAGRITHRISGERISEEFKLKDFHFAGIEASEEEKFVNLIPEDRGFVIQWGYSLRTGLWRYQSTVPFACLDQAFDFEPDGSLSKHASRDRN